MTLENKVGLEAEFFLTSAKGNLVFPGSNGFDTDEFIILGEFRSEPGINRSETLSNFFKEYYRIVEKAKSKNLVVNLDGIWEIDLKKKAEILRKMGTKTVSESKNIYKTDLLELSDDIIEDGKITGRYLSTGLHVHFSSQVICEKVFPVGRKYSYTPMEIPLVFGDGIKTNLELFKRDQEHSPSAELVEAIANRITKPVIEHFVKEMDKNLLKHFLLLSSDKVSDLKFRQPGFYEVKSYGRFEYRSLPFNRYVLEDIYKVVDFSFKLLEEL